MSGRKQRAAVPTHHGLVVSDHAVVRYLERVMGIDVEAVRARIVDHSVAAAAREFTRVCVAVDGSHRVIVESGKVVTVLRLADAPAARPPRGGR